MYTAVVVTAAVQSSSSRLLSYGITVVVHASMLYVLMLLMLITVPQHACDSSASIDSHTNFYQHTVDHVVSLVRLASACT